MIPARGPIRNCRGYGRLYFCADPHNQPIDHPKVTTFTDLAELPALWSAWLGYYSLRPDVTTLGRASVGHNGSPAGNFSATNSAAAALSAIITNEGCNLSTEAGTSSLTGPSPPALALAPLPAPLTISSRFFAAITLFGPMVT